MNEADAYKIAAEVLHPFEDRIDVSTGQTLSDRIVCALFEAHKEGQNITSAMHSDGDKKCLCPHYYNSDYCGYFKKGQCEHPRR